MAAARALAPFPDQARRVRTQANPPGFLCAPASPGPVPAMATLSGSSAFFSRPAPRPRSEPSPPKPCLCGLPVPSGLFYQFPCFIRPRTDLGAENTVRRPRLGAECGRPALRPQGRWGQDRNTADQWAPCHRMTPARQGRALSIRRLPNPPRGWVSGLGSACQ